MSNYVEPYYVEPYTLTYYTISNLYVELCRTMSKYTMSNRTSLISESDN